MSRMLLGETEPDLATAVKEFFSHDQYTVQVETSGLQILQCLRENQYDVVLLETNLAGLDGISVIRDYRHSGGSVPIILMAGMHSSDELRRGLDAGADAYVAKPFRLCDLAARVKAALRRPAMRSEKVLIAGPIAMDTEAGIVTKDDIPIHLHPMEFKLLHFLLIHPDQVFSAHALFERIWRKEYGLAEDTVRTHVRTLRQKIDSKGCPSVITTIRGLGYKVSLTSGAHRQKDLTVTDRPRVKLILHENANVPVAALGASA